MKKILLYMMGLSLACSLQANDCTTIVRHLQEQDDKKAMWLILGELEDKDDALINTFINEFIEECTLQEREYLKNQVVMRLYVASVPTVPTGELLAMMRDIGVLVGDQAPNFAVNDSTLLYDLLGEKTLLFFYETSCNLCHKQKNELIVHRQALEEKGVRIISVDCNATKTDSQAWQYNIADPLGEIHHPYGILSTPTFILLDKQGVIVGRYNRLANTDLL